MTPTLTERVLARLELHERPQLTLQGLRDLYGAWCRRVPFDNFRKLISLRSAHRGPLPGETPADFFEAWLRDGTGGTCWAGAGALHALLHSLDFDATRVLATMLTRPGAESNHGTVIVTIDATRYLVDTAMLHDVPIAVVADPPRWSTRWRPLHQLAGVECRLDELGVTAIRFGAAHEATRSWSLFNGRPYLRINRDSRVLGLDRGHRIEIRPDGTVSQEKLGPRAAFRFLVDDIGIRSTVAQILFEPQ